MTHAARHGAPRAKRARRRRALTSGAAQLALLAQLTLAHAQPTSEAMPSGNASEQLVEQAVALLDAGNDQDALLVLQQAAIADPTSARVRVHLAAVHQAMNEWLPAEEHLLFALGQQDDAYVTEHRDALSDALQSIQAHLSSLIVTGEPAGAEVFLDGQPLGTLPLELPTRVVSGTHVLRVSMRAHRSYASSLETPPGVLVDQVVHLEDERAPVVRAPAKAYAPPATSSAEQADSSHWLAWTFAGVGGAAALTSAVAFTLREVHAGRWNSRACLEPGRSRAEVCPGERDRVQLWDRTLVVSGVAAAALLGGALIGWSLEHGPAQETAALTDCGLGLGGLSCRGQF
jgi:hypothetical protein